MTVRWIIRQVEAADIDYTEVLQRTARDFGAIQAGIYAETLDCAIDALGADGTATIGVKERDEIGAGIFSLHAARLGRKASHFIVFRVVEHNIIEILRILHERMDLARHISIPE
jgi:toxin ParE1/3/4